MGVVGIPVGAGWGSVMKSEKDTYAELIAELIEMRNTLSWVLKDG